MKRLCVAVLAVPALALGFTLASPDEARADSIHTFACWQAGQYVADAYSYGDYETAQYIEGWMATYC